MDSGPLGRLKLCSITHLVIYPSRNVPTNFADEAIVFSGLQAEPRSYLNIGEKVRIEIGPLAGTEGILTALKGSARLVVSVSLLQRSVSVEINESWVSPADPLRPLRCAM